ncbi:MAG: hypothetical protein ABIG44_16095 [Planctomycetota bacterium]
MKDPKEQRARDIMQRIHDVLWNDWDPIGVRDMGGPEDEYDSYIGRVYRLLASGASKQELTGALRAIQTDCMGMLIENDVELETVTDKLLALDVSLHTE